MRLIVKRILKICYYFLQNEILVYLSLVGRGAEEYQTGHTDPNIIVTQDSQHFSPIKSG